MAETNKILEVTYGAFSCRLEGFEDAVETMKTVVAYFYELSGHDDFMDMPSQAPDAATLALLTQEQTGATVEVENTDTGVSLRVQSKDEDTVEDIDATHEDEVEEAVAETMAQDDAIDEEDEARDEIADDDLTAEKPEQIDADATDDDDDEDTADSDINTKAENAAKDTTADDEAAIDGEELAPAATDTETSVTDKLDRIRAVVGRGTPPADDGYAEDISETDPDDTPKPANPLAQRLAELAKRNSQAIAADDLAEQPEIQTADSDDDDAEITASDDTDDDFSDDPTPTDAFEFDATALRGGTSAVALLSSDPDKTKAEFTVAQDAEVDESNGYQDDMANIASADDEMSDADDTPEETSTLILSDAEDDDALSRPLLLTSRQTRMTDDEDEDEDFDLASELAAVEREIAARPGNEIARHGLPRSVEDAMSRILNETNEHLNEPESKRHRDAFAQLKAAVAATEASRQLGDANKSRDIGETFRDDLGALDAEGKEKGEGLPPLKLVTPVHNDPMMDQPAAREAEKAPKEAKPVDAATLRLREIAAKVANRDTSADMTFAKFAEQQGAHDLSDLLEAAAAYIAYVDGDNDFSRPQVMKVVQSASEEEISREDGLRSFGRLLRQSRIIKLNNGRFQVAESTRFRPDTDKVARG